MNRPVLQNLKVVDLTQILAGPYCSMVLGDMGAEVIKVEKYPNGDDTRQMGPYVNGESYPFLMVNRNKKSLRLNLKTNKGKEIFYRLIKESDVFMENFRPGTVEKLGIDYETLRSINPSLIYCSISGYGQTGPYSHKGGYDIMAQGLSGMMDMTGEKDGRPVKTGIAIHDIAAAMTALQSILFAYIHRLQSGEGQYIDLSLVDSGLAWTVWEAAAYFGAGEVAERNGTAHRVSAPYQGFRTKDGNILIGAGNQKLWEVFCKNVLGKKEWIHREEYLTNTLRKENRLKLEREIEEILTKERSAYWLRLLEENGIPCGPINRYDEAINDPHTKAREMVISYEHPTAGTVKTLGFPAKFSVTPPRITRPAPLLGEHSKEILSELSYDEEEIEHLFETGII
jgi:crotonobetainyl-CoA:carnitine CoA-transferase CaiB-like acyl-CoA transferase